MGCIKCANNYRAIQGAYDEYFHPSLLPHTHIEPIASHLLEKDFSALLELQQTAENLFQKRGVTFNVYHHEKGIEKIFPFDLFPRVLSQKEWAVIDAGLKQRVKALNAFLNDFYGQQQIINDGIIPKHLILTSKCYFPKLHGISPPGKTYIHIAGIDLIRLPSGEFCVLEDNLRTPSGVSYALQNRLMMKSLCPDLLKKQKIEPVDSYPLMLNNALASLSERYGEDLCAVLLTPGPYNAAYYEHLFLAKEMGFLLVRSDDLYVDEDKVYVKTAAGPRRVDIIYRRIDEEYLDPEFFRDDTLLGIRGLMRAYRLGHVVLANAPGNGIADDKAIYTFIPAMIRYYLNENPILNQIETLLCDDKDQLNHVLQHMDSYVIKRVDASGGYGMLIGPQSSTAEQHEFSNLLQKNPRGYIAQPLIELSCCPTLTENGLVAKRVDLRPYIVTGTSSWVLPGGLTRVALEENSYIVNSSQGGGSKDTWVLADEVIS
jgi:uncharacterized circularly permuted ATP-grasp superfamily protein